MEYTQGHLLVYKELYLVRLFTAIWIIYNNSVPLLPLLAALQFFLPKVYMVLQLEF
jgi:hypothetical protein